MDKSKLTGSMAEMQNRLEAYMKQLWPNFKVGAPMLRHLIAWRNNEVKNALQDILDNSSGGGNWRRNTITAINNLDKDKAGE
jgi:hypothetical protein